MEIKIKEKFGETVDKKEHILELEDLISGAKEAVLNFGGVYFMSPEAAQQYLKMKRKAWSKITEEAMSQDLKDNLNAMDKNPLG
ncbi:MAG: hypothetical protein ACLFNK_05095 [Candidatus Woesearchaeota archaeon]